MRGVRATTWNGGWVDGDRGNYGLRVRFDKTLPGYVGVTQEVSVGSLLVQRVLLSPAQVRALLRFLGR